MNPDLLGLAFAAGMVAAFNPCGFAMLPAYLALVIQREGVARSTAVGRALLASAAMTLGFVAVFGVFGLLTVSVASTVQRYLPYGTVVVGVILIVVGLWLLSGRVLPSSSMGKGGRWAPTARMWSMVGYGVGYALASLSCTVGPFLAVTASSLRSGTLLGVVGVYAGYVAGIALVVSTLSVAVALASTGVIDRMRRTLPYVNRVSGVLLVAVGVYVVYYGWFEVRLAGGGTPTGDPVISAAGRIQGAVAGWVYQHGAWPWLGALGVAVAVLAVSLRRNRRTGADARSPVDSVP